MENIFDLVYNNKVEAIKKLKDMGGVLDFTNKDVMDGIDQTKSFFDWKEDLTKKLNTIKDEEYLDLPIVLLERLGDECGAEEASVVLVRIVEGEDGAEDDLEFIAFREFDLRQENDTDLCDTAECLYNSDNYIYEAIDAYWESRTYPKISPLQDEDAIYTTSFFGGVFEASTNELIEKFGKPFFYDPDNYNDKTTREWNLQLEDGTPFAIYDWKAYQKYDDDKVVTWHIGTTKEGKQTVAEALKKVGLDL